MRAARITRTESEIVNVGDKSIPVEREKEYWGNSLEFDMQGAPRLTAEMVSEGTLLVLGISAVLYESGRVCSCSTTWTTAFASQGTGHLISLLRKLLESNPDLQIVATSHSPYLLDHLSSNEVRIISLNDNGTVSVGRFSDHPAFEKWKDEIDSGEFWSLVEEKWITEKVGAAQS